jgi:hypothetical protein
MTDTPAPLYEGAEDEEHTTAWDAAQLRDTPVAPTTPTGRNLVALAEHWDIRDYSSDPKGVDYPDVEGAMRHFALAIEAEAGADGWNRANEAARNASAEFEARSTPAEAESEWLKGFRIGYEDGQHEARSTQAEARKPGCIYQHPHPSHECRNQDDMRSTPAEALDAATLAKAAENHTEEHKGIGGLHPEGCWQWIANEYARLRSPESDR